MFVMSLYLFCNNTMAVTSVKTLIIVQPMAINPYEQIWTAVCMGESHQDNMAYNPLEQATGIVQIRPIRLLDYNQRTGSSYTLDDCYNVVISKKIFMYYAQQFNPNEYDKIASDWNKCPTTAYWLRIKPFMDCNIYS